VWHQGAERVPTAFLGVPVLSCRLALRHWEEARLECGASRATPCRCTHTHTRTRKCTRTRTRTRTLTPHQFQGPQGAARAPLFAASSHPMQMHTHPAPVSGPSRSCPCSLVCCLKPPHADAHSPRTSFRALKELPVLLCLLPQGVVLFRRSASVYSNQIRHAPCVHTESSLALMCVQHAVQGESGAAHQAHGALCVLTCAGVRATHRVLACADVRATCSTRRTWSSA